jgi:hypothetical protein
MTDVVAVGLITGLSGVAGAAISAIATSRVSTRSADAAISTAQSSAEVELAKIEAENDRLREQAREHERQRRYEVYEKAMAAHIELFSLCQVGEVSVDAVKQAIERVHSVWSAIQLTEIAEVRASMARYGYLIAEISTTTNVTGDNWSVEFQRRIDDVKGAANDLAKEMRKGIALAEA